MNYKQKYLKYKLKYNNLTNLIEKKGGSAANASDLYGKMDWSKLEDVDFNSLFGIAANAANADANANAANANAANANANAANANANAANANAVSMDIDSSEEDKYHEFVIIDLEFKDEFIDFYKDITRQYKFIRDEGKNDSLVELIPLLTTNINDVFNINVIKFRVHSVNELKDLSLASIYELIKTGILNIINLSMNDLKEDGKIMNDIRANIIGNFNDFIGSVNIIKNSQEYGINKFFHYELQNKLLMPENIFETQMLSKNQQIEVNKDRESLFNWCLLPNQRLNNGKTCIIYMNMTSQMMINYSQDAKGDAPSKLMKEYLLKKLLKITPFDRGDEIPIIEWNQHDWNRLPIISESIDIPHEPNFILIKNQGNLILRHN
jgi:hypothetical protein